MESLSHSSMDWQGFVAHWQDMNEDARQSFLQEVAKHDRFIPESVDDLTFDDFQKLDPIIQLLDMEVRNGMPSYVAYERFLQKVKALYIDTHPDDFDALSLEDQKEVARNKYDCPTEVEVDRFVFALLDAKAQTTLSGSFTFEEKVEELCHGDNSLAQKLNSIYREYREYFDSQRHDAAE
ncbi:MAG TPA: hypothetical protein PKA32_04345 [Candidatus Gracilibacteria bacterium]|nr:hypothetical protein [Candidatus Gracilibacteria bacterium]